MISSRIIEKSKKGNRENLEKYCIYFDYHLSAAGIFCDRGPMPGGGLELPA